MLLKGLLGQVLRLQMDFQLKSLHHLDGGGAILYRGNSQKCHLQPGFRRAGLSG